MTFESISRPSRTTAAAVSSHEVSIPSTSNSEELREAFQKWRLCDATFSNDRGHKFVWCDIERRIEDRYSLRDDFQAFSILDSRPNDAERRSVTCSRQRSCVAVGQDCAGVGQQLLTERAHPAIVFNIFALNREGLCFQTFRDGMPVAVLSNS